MATSLYWVETIISLSQYQACFFFRLSYFVATNLKFTMFQHMIVGLRVSSFSLLQKVTCIPFVHRLNIIVSLDRAIYLGLIKKRKTMTFI